MMLPERSCIFLLFATTPNLGFFTCITQQWPCCSNNLIFTCCERSDQSPWYWGDLRSSLAAHSWKRFNSYYDQMWPTHVLALKTAQVVNLSSATSNKLWCRLRVRCRHGYVHTWPTRRNFFTCYISGFRCTYAFAKKYSAQSKTSPDFNFQKRKQW